MVLNVDFNDRGSKAPSAASVATNPRQVGDTAYSSVIDAMAHSPVNKTPDAVH